MSLVADERLQIEVPDPWRPIGHVPDPASGLVECCFGCIGFAQHGEVLCLCDPEIGCQQPESTAFCPPSGNIEGGENTFPVGCQVILAAQAERLVHDIPVVEVESRETGFCQQPRRQRCVSRFQGKVALFQQHNARQWMIVPSIDQQSTIQMSVGFLNTTHPDFSQTELECDPGTGPMVGWRKVPARQDIHQLLGDWVMFTQRAQDGVSATNGQSGCTDNLGCFQFEVLGYFNDGDPLTFDFFEGGLPAVKNQHGVRQRSNRELAIALSPRWLRASNSIGVGPWRRLKFDP